MAEKFTCDCEVIHEEVVNEVKEKMQPKEDNLIPSVFFAL